jgi:hypothetical protein
MHRLFYGFLAVWVVCASCSGLAQGPVQQAQEAVDASLRKEVLMVKVQGPAGAPNVWTVYFYDASLQNKTRMARVVDGKLEQLGPAEHKQVAKSERVFDPDLVKVSYDQAWGAVKAKAQEKAMTFDAVNAYLYRKVPGESPVWEFELRQAGASRGIFELDSNGVFASYQEARPAAVKKGGAAGFFQDVERTFLGIGGDLEEFFTGDRTVDR